jgi:hypothetical protein
MDVTEIFKDSFNYGTKDFTKILILGALLVGVVILGLLGGVIGIATGSAAVMIIFFLIMGIFAFIIGLIYSGYGLSIIRDTISDIDETLPEFDWANNLVDGLKVFVLYFLYMLIPGLIYFVLMIIFGFSSVALISSAGAGAFIASIFGVIIIVVIVAVIFELFATIAMARLAETGRFGSIFEFSEINQTISNIGWGNYIIWFILLMIICMVIGFVAGLVGWIPIIGQILVALILPGFLVIFSSRATGLIYKESKQ